MSAYMVNNRTLTKIAKYMEVCANYKSEQNRRGLCDLSLSDEFKEWLYKEGLVDKKTGRFSAPLIHALLYRRNRHALIQRYGEESVAKEMGLAELEPMEDGGTKIDISEVNRREWLSNLYTVCRCYKYQIAEGDFRDDKFYWLFGEWIGQMAGGLAAYVVAEYRPGPTKPNWKSWEEF